MFAAALCNYMRKGTDICMCSVSCLWRHSADLCVQRQICKLCSVRYLQRYSAPICVKEQIHVRIVWAVCGVTLQIYE